MPAVWLDRPCSAPEDLPDVCAQCGAEATGRVKKNFSWTPPWVIITIIFGLLIYVILALILTKRCTVAVPMCGRHRNHWLWRTSLSFGSFFLLIPGGVGLMLLTFTLAKGSDMEGLGVLWLVGGFVAWLIFLVVCNFAAIRTGEIADDRIKLTGVCAGFRDACEELADSQRRPPRAALERWDERRERGPRRERGDDERVERPDRRPDRYREEEEERPRKRQARDAEEY